MSDIGRFDWEKLAAKINGYYSMTLTAGEVERIFKSAIKDAVDPLTERLSALEGKSPPNDRDMYGRRQKART